jgi:GTPase SAR1 family protein
MNLKTLKIGLIGECKTGKTSLARFFASNGTCFSRDYHLTSGVEVFTKIVSRVQNDNNSSSFLGAENGVQITELECQGRVEHLKVKVYDFGGSEIYHEPIVFPVLEQLSHFVIVFDLGQRESFEAIDKWMGVVKGKVSNLGKVVLLGNLHGEDRKVEQREIMQWAQRNKIQYFETGMNEYEQVDQVFKEILKTVIETNS